MKLLLCAALLALAAGTALWLFDRYLQWLCGPDLDSWRDAHTAQDYSTPLETCPLCRATKFIDRPCWNCAPGSASVSDAGSGVPPDPSAPIREIRGQNSTPSFPSFPSVKSVSAPSVNNSAPSV